MKIKATILLFVIGAVAVLAEKRNSEDDENGGSASKNPQFSVGQITIDLEGPKGYNFSSRPAGLQSDGSGAPSGLLPEPVDHHNYDTMGYSGSSNSYGSDSPSGLLPEPVDHHNYDTKGYSGSGSSNLYGSNGQSYDIYFSYESYSAPEGTYYELERPQGSQELEDPQLLLPGEWEKYFKKFMKALQKLVTKTKGKFENWEKKIKGEKEKIEELLKKKLDATEQRVKTQQEAEVTKAVRKGKDRKKIQECFDEENLDFKRQMSGDLESAVKCVKDATDDARSILESSKDSFTKTTDKCTSDAQGYNGLVKTCVSNGDGPCIQEGVNALGRTINSISKESNRHSTNLDETAKNLKDQMNNCREDFEQKLRRGKDAYATKVKQCVQSTEEVSKPKEEEKEKEREEEKQVEKKR